MCYRGPAYCFHQLQHLRGMHLFLNIPFETTIEPSTRLPGIGCELIHEVTNLQPAYRS